MCGGKQLELQFSRSAPEFSWPLALVMCSIWWPGVTEATGTPPGRRANPGEGAPVRDPHAAQEGQLLPHLVVQVPNALQADRCHLPHHVPARVRSIQPCLLVHIPVP